MKRFNQILCYAVLCATVSCCHSGHDTNNDSQPLAVQEVRVANNKHLNLSMITNNVNLAKFNDVAYGNGSYVVVGNNGSIVVSTDAKEWHAVDGITTENLNAITFNKEKQLFYAVGDNGTLISSANGSSWSIYNKLNPNVNLTAITTVRLGDEVIGGVDGYLFELQLSGSRNLIVPRATGDAGTVTGIAFNGEGAMVAATSIGHLYYKGYGEFKTGNWTITENGSLRNGISDVQHERTDDWFIATTYNGDVIQAQLAIDPKGAHVNWSQPVNIGSPSPEELALGGSANSIALDPKTLDFLVVGGSLHNFARYSSDFNFWDDLGSFQDVSGFPQTYKLNKIKCFANEQCVAVGDMWTIVTGSDKSWSDTSPKFVGLHINAENEAVVGIDTNLSLVADFESGFSSGVVNPNLVKWSSSDTAIATVNANGTVSPIKSGYTTITAEFDNHSAHYELYVLNGHITEIHTSKPEYKVNLTLSREVTLGAFVSLDTGESVTIDNRNLTCKLPNETKLIADSTDSCKFHVKDDIDDLGTVDVQVQYKNFVTTAKVEVLDETVKSVKVDLDDRDLLPNSPAREIKVTTNYEGVDYDVTSLASISTTDPSIVSVFGNKIYAYKPGTVSLTIVVGDAKVEQSLTVQALDVQLPDSMPKGTSSPVAVKVVTESGLVYDVTDKVSLTSSESSIIDIVNGTVEAKDVGTAIITAKLADGSSVSKSITVDPVVIKSIEIGTELTTLRVGESQDLQLFGTYSDGSRLAIANELVKWQESPVGVVQFISNKMIAKQVAVATITGEYDGLSVSKSFNVTPAVLTGVSFESSQLNLVGLIGDFKVPVVRAHYSDKTIQTLDSTKLTCTSSNANVASVYNGCSIKAVAPGSAVITLNYDATHSAKLNVSVTGDQISSMVLNFESANFYLGQSRSYTISAIVNGKSYDVTNSVNLYSRDNSILSVNNTTKKIDAVKAGNTNLYLTYDNKTFIEKPVQALADSVASVKVSIAGNPTQLMPHAEYNLAIDCTTKSGRNVSGLACGANLALKNETGSASLSGNATNGYKLLALKAASASLSGSVLISNSVTSDSVRFNVGPLYNEAYEMSNTSGIAFSKFIISDEKGGSLNIQEGSRCWFNGNNEYYCGSEMSYHDVKQMMVDYTNYNLSNQGRYLKLNSVVYNSNGSAHWIDYNLTHNTTLKTPFIYFTSRNNSGQYCTNSVWKNANNHYTLKAVGEQSDMGYGYTIWCNHLVGGNGFSSNWIAWHGTDAMRIY